jgi:hypothetical protein
VKRSVGNATGLLQITVGVLHLTTLIVVAPGTSNIVIPNAFRAGDSEDARRGASFSKAITASLRTR